MPAMGRQRCHTCSSPVYQMLRYPLNAESDQPFLHGPLSIHQSVLVVFHKHKILSLCIYRCMQKQVVSCVDWLPAWCGG